MIQCLSLESMNVCIQSQSTSTNELPTLRHMLLAFPLKNPLIPSLLLILLKQSTVPVNITSFEPLCIMSLLRMVSRGQAKVSEEEVMIWAKRKRARKEDLRWFSSLPQMKNFPASQPPKQKALQTKMPATDTPKPRYSPRIPSDCMIFLQQSSSPLNCRWVAYLPTSTPSLVLAKSRGYTKIKLKAPAQPPESKDPMKYLNWFLDLSMPERNVLLSASLVAKFMAWVGKYRTTFAQFPRQSEATPSYDIHLLKQSTIPLYGLAASLGLLC